MNRSLRTATLALSLLLGPGLAVAAGTGNTAGPDWRAWNEGMAQAKSANRPVIVNLYTNWCGWCRRMDKDIYQKAEIAEYLRKHYVTIKINGEASDPATYEGKKTTSAGLAQRFRVSGYPTTVFLRSNGDHMANVPGYVAADKFMLLLRYVAEGYADRNVPFTEFEKTVKSEPARR